MFKKEINFVTYSTGFASSIIGSVSLHFCHFKVFIYVRYELRLPTLLLIFYSIFINVAAHAASTLRSGNVSTRSRPKTETTENESIEPAVTGECPEPEGFFPDPYQCDKYFQCKDNVVVAQKLCPDGMVFNDFSPTHEKCDLPFNIDCSKRPELRKCNHIPQKFFYLT